jgi:WD40 repeat protein/type II secretory pathway predicted ATPase ExeA
MPSDVTIFRVFVSSTFGDMVDERRMLQDDVFPRLAAYCRERSALFQAVDLRWGISPEAARDRRTMEICLGEVRRCREVSPALNFVALIGDRYGWRPLPTAIPGSDFEALLAAAPRRDRALLGRAYRRDDNAVPAAYRLPPQPSRLTDAEVATREQALREALDRALEAAFADGDPRRRAHGAAATHLEIAERLSLDPDDRRCMLCYLREPAGLDAAPLATLKAELASRLDETQLHSYRGVELEAWRDRIEADLTAAVCRALEGAAGRPRPDAHEALAAGLARDAVGQRALLGRIRRYLEWSEGELPLVVTGVPGSGKSTVVARAWLEARAAADGAIVVGRLVGATPESTSIEGLLRGLCGEIDAALGNDEPLPAGADALGKALNARLAAATAEQPLVLFVDGLEQLETQNARLAWLPTRLPPNARLVLSAVDDGGDAGEALCELRERWPRRAFAAVPPLSAREAGRLLDHRLAAAGRRLQLAQRAAVLAAWNGCPVPLFLQLVVQQACAWRSSDRPSRLASDVPRLLAAVFARLASEHGRVLVRGSVGLLCAARWGLAEDEVLSQLTADPVVMTALAERFPHWPLEGRVPFVVWARLHADLAPYLTSRAADGTEVEAFAHGTVRRAAESFAFGRGDHRPVHAALAASFSSQPDRFAGGLPNRRKLSELAYQLTQAREWPALASTLTALPFLQAKCGAGLTTDLVGDYDRALAAMRAHGGPAAELADWRAFVVRERAAFEAHADVDGFVLQQAHNSGPDGEVARGWLRVGAEYRGRQWLRLDARSGGSDAVVATLERHADGATDCVFDATGEWLFSSGMDGAVLGWRSADWGLAEVVAELPGSADSVAVTADGQRVASACADGLIRIHDRRTRTTIACEERFRLHPRRCRFVQGDRRLLAVGAYGLKLFDASSGRLLKSDLEETIFNDCTATPGSLVTLGDCDGRVLGYDLAARKVRFDLYLDDVSRVQGSALSADGRRLIAAGGRFTAEDDIAPFGASGMWDLADESELDEQRLPKPALNCLYVDGERHYVVGLQDGTLRVHRSSDHELVGQFGEHDDGVRGLALAPGGRELVTASFDDRLIVWRTDALVASGRVARAAEQGIFCAVAAGGRAGWAMAADVDRFRAYFRVQTLGRGAQPPLERPHRLAELPIQRSDPGMPMQVYEAVLRGIGPRAPHRGSPVAGDGACWLVHAGARISPSAFHLLPELPRSRWSSENLTWTRAPDGRQTAVVRASMVVVDEAAARRVAVRWFANDRAREPVASHELDLPLQVVVGPCHFSGDSRRVRLAIGAAVVELDRDGRGRELVGGESPVTAFCESHEGRLLLVAHADGHLQLWDTGSGAALRRYDAHDGEAVDAVFVDGRRFVSVGQDATLRLWRTTGPRCEAVFVARAALAAVDAGRRGRRVLAVDVHGGAYWLSVERGA